MGIRIHNTAAEIDKLYRLPSKTINLPGLERRLAWLSDVRVLNRRKVLSLLSFTRYGSGYSTVSIQSIVAVRYYSY
jgi:hypothetical protein